MITGLVTGVFVPLRVGGREAAAGGRDRAGPARGRQGATPRRGRVGRRDSAGGRIRSRASRESATCALADDGLYCLSDDGRWGARVRFAPGAPEIGDVALAAPPCLVKGGSAAVAAICPDWLVPVLASLPPDGLLLQFESGLTWFVAVPDPEDWFAALMLAIRPRSSRHGLATTRPRPFHERANAASPPATMMGSGGEAMATTANGA